MARFHEGPLWVEIESSGESRRAPGELVELTSETGWYDHEAGTAIIHGPEQAHEAFFLADAATNWLDGLAEDEPFFLRVDTWGPHPPYTIPTGLESPFGDSEIRLADNLAHDLSTRPRHHADYRDLWRENLREDAFDWSASVPAGDRALHSGRARFGMVCCFIWKLSANSATRSSFSAPTTATR